MLEARLRYSRGPCPGCNKKVKLHIDHDETPFAQILDEFLKSKKLNLLRVSINYTAKPFTLLSRTLAAEWQAWHDEEATLTGLCKSCNSAKGSGGYRHKL